MTWREIPRSGGYQASDSGDSRSPSGRVLKQSKNQRDYMRVSLGRARQDYVHRLVMEAFVGPANGRDVDHIDNDPTNNHLSNLRYVTHAENMKAIQERQTMCRRGLHSMDDAVWSGGRRQCRHCRRERDRNRYQKNGSRNKRRATKNTTTPSTTTREK